ncbi:hypothetical protein QJV14_12040 [Listeria cossartiae subsp. cayugensis]|uniref:hypothetical protein n=1 Tax=Listeria cossartiae TaxID=2838249 RepID=UPI001624DA55|nr:hypothetical protein [Listeria cossartiae]MBC2192614.1 hypothetical protein [Listeria cossartiae subsp. cossartiae]MDT0003817.1 hypothetical protein [Listeria cossartiae subsp. cayugensis]MDT0020211.1 hypothetical protein [Listeria cossartiae subsp. cayugensis]MDT0036574.1 hypothetical protein [Listeria cossartiae subsp. cayugensis]MDT0041962.1 hypothetical protein [Listeria cossartiae subsp. cayugensis]
MTNKINDIDFKDRIIELRNNYESSLLINNFFSDVPKSIRGVLKELQTETYPEIKQENKIYHDLRKITKESEKALLIECYTIAEQMLKNAKYQLLSFDETDNSPSQKFLKYKINPEKFSPSPRVSEINSFFKRYGGNKLFISTIEIYDNMIIERHRYAHRGLYAFSIEDIPKIIDILLYLEFEFRMFLDNNEWVKFFTQFYSINSNDKKKAQEKYSLLRKDLISMKQCLINLITNEDIIVFPYVCDLLDAIKSNENYVEVKKVLMESKRKLKF